jgi:hypothetical protein
VSDAAGSWVLAVGHAALTPDALDPSDVDHETLRKVYVIVSADG